MDRQLEKYYEAQFDLFLTQGWKDFTEDVKRLKESLPTIEQVSPENLRFVQGQIDILNWLLDRKNLVETAYKDLKED
jgi:hypothetical protein